MGRKGKHRALTELEGATLGVVIRDGPVTSYAVKELFRGSPSEFWSGSAGSIYPLMHRLEECELVASERGSTGLRRRRVYRSTPAGRRAFRTWLTDAERAAAMGFDPLRTRLVFFDRLSPRDRARFRDSFEAALELLPPPLPGTSASLESLHRIWNRARSAAFTQFLEELDKTAGNPDDSGVGVSRTKPPDDV
jgi:DNA-binding PadR family transcriptional regulator